LHIFAVFNTNTNSSGIVQTNNETTYNLCDPNSDDGNQTLIWNNNGGDSNSSTPAAKVVPIPLTYEGSNYFFPGTMDGEQCQKGMKFGIKVLHGNGLPPALNQPPPPPYATPPSPATATEGGSGTTSPDQSSEKNGVTSMRGGMVWAGLGMLILVLMAV
jgi:Plastocyanin-like domain